MIAKPETTATHSQRTVRIAWWVAFVLTVALLAALGLARSASAAGAPGAAKPSPPIATPPFETEEECEADEPNCEEEFSAEECEEGEEAECEEGFEEGEEAPTECLLTTAQPRIAIAPEQRRLRLEVRYTVTAPADVLVGLRSAGGHGSTSVAAQKRHLIHSGSFQETVELSPAAATRALAAKQFTVRLHVLGVPSSCQRYESRHLSVKHQAHGGAVFSETAANRRAGH
jgi:hypothetical protein